MTANVRPRVYLASRSPRRRELLTQIGVDYDVLPFRTPPREDEDVCEDVLPGEDAETYVVRLARAKGEAALRRLDLRQLRQQPVLSADTTLALDDEIIGKPDDALHAMRILRSLSGRSHRVLTAVALADGTRMAHRLSISSVHFGELSDDDIHRYVASGEPFDKAGAYGIQGIAATFVREIHGSHSGIMGLPLYETAALLRAFGLLP
ncbi:MAG: Maf family protein [Candidatus Dactylopiibacterium sp.]|nr:Maf family protein [Candidatus Dactylopiibacterium sp.]